jgi:hypothetical protein
MSDQAVKIIARYASGRIKKGYSQDFFSNKPSFHLQRDPRGTTGDREEIRVRDLKAVFFVKSFKGDADRKERKRFRPGDPSSGRKVEVAFSDGEVLQGSVLGYDPRQAGFFLFPVDSESNNMRIFVVNAAVQKFRYLGVDSEEIKNEKDFEFLIPHSRDKLLMINDKERKLLKVVLGKALRNNSGRDYIIEVLGKEYIQIGEHLVRQMEEE